MKSNVNKKNALLRLIAQVLDSVIYWVLSSLPLTIFFIVITVISLTLNMQKDDVFMTILVFLAFLSFPFTYIYLNYRHLKYNSQTLGYRIVGFKLIDLNNKDLENKKIILRSTLKLILAPFFLLFMVGLLHLIILNVSNGEQGLLDKLFQTKAEKLK
jgi:uncharacterized RDD family membrane protein YckC